MGIVPPSEALDIGTPGLAGNPESHIAPLRWLLLLPTLVLLIAVGASVVGVVQQSSRGDLRPGVRTLAAIAREAAGRIVALILHPLGWLELGPRTRQNAEHPVPVLLVPGFATNRSIFWFLRQFLDHRGYACVWPVNHAGRSASLEEQVAALDKRVRVLQAATGADRVDLVGFSLGGVVAARYIRQGGADNVRRLVTIGTPWEGSEMSIPGRSVFAEQSASIEVLRELDPTLVPTTAIWSPGDPVVVPAGSAAPAGAVSVQVDGAGHLDMLLNSRVYRAIHRALGEPE